jgi:hypothetical protein
MMTPIDEGYRMDFFVLRLCFYVAGLNRKPNIDQKPSLGDFCGPGGFPRLDAAHALSESH